MYGLSGTSGKIIVSGRTQYLLIVINTTTKKIHVTFPDVHVWHTDRKALLPVVHNSEQRSEAPTTPEGAVSFQDVGHPADGLQTVLE